MVWKISFTQRGAIFACLAFLYTTMLAVHHVMSNYKFLHLSFTSLVMILPQCIYLYHNDSIHNNYDSLSATHPCFVSWLRTLKFKEHKVAVAHTSHCGMFQGYTKANTTTNLKLCTCIRILELQLIYVCAVGVLKNQL